ncbi:unnamed protein product [Penicillium roqueforti FM164]|uniref:Genomic scaffold, ProqFM164S03 n=1 Tax=Penicillium roqueforti (strain FM164) TaxID=1365484 RepID=W6QBV5_PENRF|nr:unnamed protein product [Penicillium roqueforti FM164]
MPYVAMRKFSEEGDRKWRNGWEGKAAESRIKRGGEEGEQEKQSMGEREKRRRRRGEEEEKGRR